VGIIATAREGVGGGKSKINNPEALLDLPLSRYTAGTEEFTPTHMRPAILRDAVRSAGALNPIGSLGQVRFLQHHLDSPDVFTGRKRSNPAKANRNTHINEKKFRLVGERGYDYGYEFIGLFSFAASKTPIWSCQMTQKLGRRIR